MQINTMTLPEGMALERLSSPRSSLEEGEKPFFDARTVFYDVFVDKQAGCLVAVGPPALNLESYLQRLVLRINGTATRFQLHEYGEYKLSILKAPIPEGDEYDVAFAFPDFTQTFKLTALDLPERKRVLAAISKNNDIGWITYWVDFYKSRYGVEDVYLYDNGSDNVVELEQALAGKAHVIRWNFPFGPSGKTVNMFAQVGALNHCLHRFAKHGVLFNFDIDELLTADRAAIDARLRKKGIVYFNSFLVPYRNPGKARFTHADFLYRSPKVKETARKFVCRADAVDVISYHNTWSWWRVPLLNKLRRNKPEKLLLEGGYFLHFMGISNKQEPGIQRFQEESTEGLVYDDAHVMTPQTARVGSRNKTTA